ncbi:MAG: helix-turn-helix transcriptional regulator [Desulfovibrio sp.]|nr:helix-turn-helix transcriptional regulator [Desulfovibrio sp.]
MGTKLRELCKQKKLTQEEVAALSGFSIQHMGDIERGQANPTLAYLVKLAEVMGSACRNCFQGEKSLNQILHKCGWSRQ